VRLNGKRLRERILELGLKQWVVARQSGVARRTVIRWINGEVSRITYENLQNLAKVVNLSPAELSSEIQLDLAPTAEEQEKAASMILSAQTGNMFLHSESYEAFEHLLNATRHPGMTMQQLASIYIHMMVAAAKQYEFTRAEEYAHQCIACAERCENRDLEFVARTNLAMLHSEQGRIGRMREELEKQLAMMESQGVTRGLASLHLNLAQACRMQGELARSVRMVVTALAHYRKSRDVESYAECLVQAASVCMELSAFETAQGYLLLAQQVVDGNSLDAWESVVSLRLIHVRAAMGRVPDMDELLDALKRFDRTRYKAEDSYVNAVRALRISDMAQEAVVILNRGLEQKHLRLYEKAALLLELAIIRSLAGNTELAAVAAEEAAAIFAQCGLPRTADKARRLAQAGQLPRKVSSDKLHRLMDEALPVATG
jgi:transcriptional regulator with XRE-family HTH domain